MRLFICEKPSQARDIARVLQASWRGDGYLQGQNVTVTWCIGHLLETAPPESYGDYKRWSLDDLPIIPDHWQLVVKPKVASQLKVIDQLLQRCAEVVIATDADREGEMIAREILERCQYQGPVLRLWLSALDEARSAGPWPPCVRANRPCRCTTVHWPAPVPTGWWAST